MAVRSKRNSNNRSSVKSKHYNWRYMSVMFALFVLVTALSGRIVYLQLVATDFLSEQADARSLRSERIPANRGIIKDRNGKALAVSTPVVSLWMKPKEIMAENLRWSELAAALDISVDELADEITLSQNRHFVYLKRHIAPDEAAEILNLEIKGVYSESEYRRFYPAGEVTAHVVGLTNIDDKGIEGVELGFESRLKGSPGKKKVIKNRRGEVIKDIEITQYADPGEDIMLSIDLRAQYLAYKELAYAVERYSAKSGSAVALDVKTGEILALVNSPSYNPNNRTSIDPRRLRNRAVTDLFEPGSTVKPFTVLAALESGKFSKNSKLDTRPGFIKVGNKTIRDHSNNGVIDMTTVLAKSSNVATTQIALSLKNDALYQQLNQIGFGELVNSGMPGESEGYLPYPYDNRAIEVAAMSYGYGLSVNAIQLARAYAVLANEGIDKPVSILKQDKPVIGRQVIDKKHAREITSMLEAVVSERGTASRAGVQGYSVAGKTGTVHKFINGSYAEDKYISLFAGFSPVDDPRIVLVVMIDNPKGDEYFGGLVSAPTFSKIMAGMLRVMNVPPDRLNDFEKKQQIARVGVIQ